VIKQTLPTVEKMVPKLSLREMRENKKMQKKEAKAKKKEPLPKNRPNSKPKLTTRNT
jgi:hypothetical protein